MNRKRERERERERDRFNKIIIYLDQQNKNRRKS